MIKNVLIIYNQNAGKGSGEKIALKVEKKLNKLGKQCKIENPRTLEELSLIYKNLDSRFDCVLIVGGDGTVSVNVNAMIKNNKDLPIYVFGKGTANDLARNFKTFSSFKKLEKVLVLEKVKKCDLIETQQGYAASVLAGGAFTNGAIKYNAKLKKIIGKMAYYGNAIREGLLLKSQDVRFEVDGEIFEEECFTFFIANVKNFAGLNDLAPNAKHNDGLLDLVVIKKCNFFKKLNILAFMMFRKIDKCEDVIYIQGKSFKITPITPINKNFINCDIDGNSGQEYPLDVKISNKKIRFFIND